MIRIATGLRIVSVALALHLTVVVCPGCNKTEEAPAAKPEDKAPAGPTLKEQFGSLELTESVDVPTGKVARGFAVAPDGKTVAIGGGDGSIVLIGLDGKNKRTFVGHRESVMELAFTPDSARLLSAGADNQIIVWDTKSGEILRSKKKAHNGDIKALSISPDGSLVASGSVDDRVKVWRIQTLEKVHQFDGHTMSVYATAFSPNGRFVFSGARDAEIRKWSLESGRQVGEPLRFRNSVVGLDFAPDNKTLVAASLNGEIVLIDSDEFQVSSRRKLPGRARLSDIDVSKAGLIAAVQRDGGFSLWSSKSGEEAAVLEPKPIAKELEMVSFNPKGDVALALASDGRLITVSAASGTLVGDPIPLPPVNGPVRASALHEASKQYAVASRGRLFLGTRGATNTEVEVGAGDVSALTFSPDGKQLMVGQANGQLLTVSTKDKKVASIQAAHSGAIRHLQYSKSGDTLWTAGDDILIAQLDAKTLEPKLQITDHTSPIRALAVDPTGQRLASTEANNITMVRYIDGNLIQWTRRGHAIEQLAFSPDGEILAMVEDRVFIMLYNVKEREEVKKLKGSPTRITGLAYHPSGKLIVTTDVLGGVRVWSIDDGSMVAAGDAGRGKPRTLAISASGKTILTGGMDPRGSLRLFTLGPAAK